MIFCVTKLYVDKYMMLNSTIQLILFQTELLYKNFGLLFKSYKTNYLTLNVRLFPLLASIIQSFLKIE